MTRVRLSHALDGAGLVLPVSGRIAVFRPRAEMDLSALPRERVHIVQGFKPDHDAFLAQGYEVGVAAEGRYGAAVVIAPRAKAEARALIAEAADRTDGPVVVDGQRTDGINGLMKACRARTALAGVVAIAHGKLFWFEGGDFADWAAPARQTIENGFVTAPGIFSADGIDPGSAALAAALPAKLPKRVADLGAGWGYLAQAALARTGVEELHLVEAEHAALDCARINVTDPRARFHWADATRWAPPETLDAVIMNPPFHSGRAAEPALGRAFIAHAATILKPSGRLWLVANRHLPYERQVRESFAEVREIGGDAAYKLLEAAKPRRAGRGKPLG